jgi:hypothetical protein
MLDRIYRIARIDKEGMNARSKGPRVVVRGETLMTYIKALERLHG